MPDVSVVIVNWNTRDLLRRCLDSVLRETVGVSFDVCVVDNASTDGSADMVSAEFPTVGLIRNETNRGYGAACNQAIAASGGGYILLLNPDTEFTEDVLAGMAGFMDERPAVGALGCKLANPDGSFQPSCYSSMDHWKAFAYASGLYEAGPHRLLGGCRPGGILRRIMDYPDHDRVLFPNWFRGACTMLRPEAFEQVGGFDEEFHLYCEEIDLFYRMRERGLRIAYTPDVRVVHHGEGSSSQARRRTVIEFWKSMFLLHRKHGTTLSLLKVRAAMLAGTSIRLVLLFIRLAFGARGASETFTTCGAVLKWGLR